MYFYEDKIIRRIDEIKSTIHSDSIRVEDFYVKEGNDKGDYQSSLDSGWKKAKDTDQWGGFARYQWFRTTVTIPEKWNGKHVVFFIQTPGDILWKVSAEYTVYVDGKLMGGLDVFHHEITLSKNAVAGQSYDIAFMGFSGYNERRPVIDCQIMVVEDFIWDYYHDLKVAFEATIHMPDVESPQNKKLMDVVNESINAIDFRKLGSDAYYDSIRKADEILKKGIYSLHSNNDIMISAIGHSHIDVAWLWRLMQTQEKAARSLATVDMLMDEYPDYKFIQSQPQLYDYVKKLYPDLYERLKKRVAEGRLQPEGGMWVEADCNLISGESMIRQFLVGKKFFRDEFGLDNKILWLPDVFGYSAAMPQILKGCGIDYFMTIKISWNQFNRLPMDTFYLQGIDGTKVLTHFMTTPTTGSDGHRRALPYQKTYNGVLCAETVAHSWDTYQQKSCNNDLLMAFGYGDGGGGPTREMLEAGKRLKDFPGMPKVKIEPPTEFFKRLEKNVKGTEIPTWVGELYLEFHRGTYTSIARNKKYNRKSEFLYQDIEAVSSMAELMTGMQYPLATLKDNWKIILLNQFHDIIPGSSIGPVYEDSKVQYEKILKEGHELEDQAMRTIADGAEGEGAAVTVFNMNSVYTDGLVALDIPEEYTAVSDGKVSHPVQRTADGKALSYVTGIPQFGYRKLKLTSSGTAKSSIKVSTDKMENKFFRIRFDEKAQITSIYDKIAKREVLPAGAKANVLQSFEDKPMNYNAWDIDIYYTEKCWVVDDLQSVEVLEEGPVVGTIRVKRNYLSSTIMQDISIYADVPRIDFKTTIDWKEQEILLKAAFPVDVNSTRASYEVQFGAVERNTHRNTSWDVAKFEVCAHKWADLSESDYGVSMLNDCKYGHDIHGNVMRLTLLKSGIYPFENADKEVHEFVYSIYPHKGTWVDAGTVSKAFALNNPLKAVFTDGKSGSLPASSSFVSVDNDHIVIDTVKKAEDEDAYIIRMYESSNTHASGRITFSRPLTYAAQCNMIETGDKVIRAKGASIDVSLRPFEIRTLKVRF